jgi:hypothetical protein
MRIMRKRWIPGISGLLVVLVLAGCGSSDGSPEVVTTAIFSNPAVDADITRDLASGTLSPPSVASVTGSVLSGVTFTPPSGPSLADTRGFLEFPLGTVPLGATVQYASVSIFMYQVTLSNPTRTAGAPFFLDLIDTAAFPPPVRSSYYYDNVVPFVATRNFNFINTDQGNFVEIEVTTLMQQAQYLALPSFMVRLGFDEGTFLSDPNTTRGLVEIDDSIDATAPLLIVDYY